jgi:hypothetical protein
MMMSGHGEEERTPVCTRQHSSMDAYIDHAKYQQALHVSVKTHAKVQKEAARWPCYVHHSSLRAARPTNINADVGDSRNMGRL